MKPAPRRHGNWNILQGSAGFSLVEVLVALGISAVVAWAILGLQINQSKTAAVQAEVVAMQQGLRGSMILLARELKKAGYNNPATPAGASVVAVNANGSLIYYTTDNNDDGALTGPNEHAAFCFDGNTLRFTEGNTNAVGNHPSHAHLDVMTDVQAVELRYLLANDTWTLAPANLADIRVLEITLLGRTRHADPNYTNANVYQTPSGTAWGPFNDGFRRQLLTTTVKLWNLEP